MTTSRLTGMLSEIAGEHFVAAELSRRGFAAVLTRQDIRSIDILASNADASRSVGIQVETTQKAGSEWVLTKSAADAPSADVVDSLFYVFVSLNGGAAPSYHVVPRGTVADRARADHATTVTAPDSETAPSPDDGVRHFSDFTNEYRSAWHLLGLA